MKAMILAAGRGERMRPLTDTTPKPLLKVAGKPLIQYHIEAVKAAGIEEIVINHAWLGEQLEQTLGDGGQFDVNIQYSREGTALETGGGIVRALPLLGDEFIVINGDIFTDYPISQLRQNFAEQDLTHLVMVPNPMHNQKGDFFLHQSRMSGDSPDSSAGQDAQKYTFSGIAAYRAELFAECEPGSFPLAPILRQAMAVGRAGGELYQGFWTDVGTPERLEQLNRQLDR